MPASTIFPWPAAKRISNTQSNERCRRALKPDKDYDDGKFEQSAINTARFRLTKLRSTMSSSTVITYARTRNAQEQQTANVSRNTDRMLNTSHEKTNQTCVIRYAVRALAYQQPAPTVQQQPAAFKVDSLTEDDPFRWDFLRELCHEVCFLKCSRYKTGEWLCVSLLGFFAPVCVCGISSTCSSVRL